MHSRPAVAWSALIGSDQCRPEVPRAENRRGTSHEQLTDHSSEGDADDGESDDCGGGGG